MALTPLEAKTYCWGFDKVKNKYFTANIPKYCEIKNLL